MTTVDYTYIADLAKSDRSSVCTPNTFHSHRHTPHGDICGQCKNRTCANRSIRKGELRMGRVSPAQTYDGDITEWFHPRCMFETIVRGRALTRKIEDVGDITGFDTLPKRDQDTIRALLAEAKPKYKRPPGYKPAPAPAPVPVPKPAPPPAPVPAPAPKPETTHVEVTGVRLVATDGSCSALFTGSGAHTIGRSCPALAAKRHVRAFSRTQAVLTLRAGAVPTLQSRGVNPTVLVCADGDGTARVLADREVVALEDGCHVAFCAMPELDFRVEFCTASDAGASSTAPASEASPARKRARTTSGSSSRAATVAAIEENTDEDEDGDDDDDGDEDFDPRPWCKYGAACYRKNEQHLRDFRHPHKR